MRFVARCGALWVRAASELSVLMPPRSQVCRPYRLRHSAQTYSLVSFQHRLCVLVFVFCERLPISNPIQGLVYFYLPRSPTCFAWFASAPWLRTEFCARCLGRLLCEGTEIFGGALHTVPIRNFSDLHVRFLPLVNLGQRQLSAVAKGMALLWMIWLLAGPGEETVRYFCSTVTSICSDFGVPPGSLLQSSKLSHSSD